MRGYATKTNTRRSAKAAKCAASVAFIAYEWLKCSSAKLKEMRLLGWIQGYPRVPASCRPYSGNALSGWAHTVRVLWLWEWHLSWHLHAPICPWIILHTVGRHQQRAVFSISHATGDLQMQCSNSLHTPNSCWPYSRPCNAGDQTRDLRSDSSTRKRPSFSGIARERQNSGVERSRASC